MYDDTCHIVVAALDESQIIAETVRALRKHFRRIIVVDDGSTDNTADEALKAGAVVVRHPINLGQGAAIHTGILFALREGASYIATFDADGQHLPEDIPAMLAMLCTRRLDIVLGSRFLGQAAGLPTARRLLLKAAVVFTRLTTGLWLTDTHNGLRVMTADAARRLNLIQDRMAHASELLAQVAKSKLRYEEMPVTIAYTPYSLQKGQRVTGMFRIVADLVVGWLSR